MPNTVVKLTNVESTWLEAAWKDRKLLINLKKLNRKIGLFCCVRYLRRWAFEGESALGGIPEG